MVNGEELLARIQFRREALARLREAYLALVSGGVKSYMIDDRQLTRLDLSALSREIRAAEEELDELEALLDGARPRKAFAVIPRDW